jgi:hypothetical protein
MSPLGSYAVDSTRGILASPCLSKFWNSGILEKLKLKKISLLSLA